jgi:DNA-binding CsgD family transcriptional regulator
MAKTLFFLEAAALAALAFLLPVIASEVAAAFLVPFALSLLLPLACVLSIWPAKTVRDALLLVFSTKGRNIESREAAIVLEALETFSKPVSVVGLILALAVAAARLPLSGAPRAWSWLGAYLSLYALVNVTLWQTLAAVVGRLPPIPAIENQGAPEAVEAIAAKHGLSPRELQAALLIAGGMSYKETAAELGISIKTVKTHMGRVYEKTGAASNVALSLLFRGTGNSRANHTKVR